MLKKTNIRCIKGILLEFLVTTVLSFYRHPEASYCITFSHQTYLLNLRKQLILTHLQFLKK